MSIHLKRTGLHVHQISGMGLTLAAFVLAFISFNYGGSRVAVSLDADCQEVIRSEAILDPNQLVQLEGREDASRQDMHQLLGQPYCLLPKVSIRFETITEREAYLTPDKGRIILAYENDRYIGYSIDPLPQPKRSQVELELRRTLGVQSGEQIANRRVVAGLGDLSLESTGEVYAPTNGHVEANFALISEGTMTRGANDCVLFTSPQLPTYMSRLCGLKKRNVGSIQQNKAIGETNGYLHVALLSLRRNEDRSLKWMYVSPSPDFVKRFFLP